MTGVIYARYSSDNQREESIEGQIRENTAFAEKNGIVIVGHYIDRAVSAKTDNRPEFQRMIRDSAKKTFDVVIVWKLDRFSRNRYDSAKYKAALKKNNVRVVSATEAISEGAEGIILESVLEGMAEYYSADLAEKVTRGLTENALKCRFNGGNGLPYGYTVDEEKHFQIDPLKAPIVAEIFERYAHGESIAEIVHSLNARGLKTQKGKAFNHGTLNRMLGNKSYMGVYHYNGIEIPGGVPAIVSEDTFKVVERRMAKNKHASAKNKAEEKYVLTTKLFCGKCHTMMVGDSAQKKNGNIYRYYKCASAKRHECDKKAVRKEWIEELVLNKVIKVLFDDEALDKIADEIIALLDEDNKVIPLLEAQLKEVRKSIDNVMKAIEAGIITRSTKAKLEELEAEEEQIELNILKEQTSSPKLTKEQILFALDKFRKLDLTIEANKERLIDSLVKCIILYDDKLVITFNFKNEPVTVPTSDELEAIEGGSDIEAFASPKQKDTPCECPFVLAMRSAQEPTQNAKRFEYGFAFAAQSASSLLVSGKRANIRLWRNSRTSVLFAPHSRCFFRSLVTRREYEPRHNKAIIGEETLCGEVRIPPLAVSCVTRSNKLSVEYRERNAQISPRVANSRTPTSMLLTIILKDYSTIYEIENVSDVHFNIVTLDQTLEKTVIV